MRVSLMKCGNDDKLVYIVDSTRVDNKIKTIVVEKLGRLSDLKKNYSDPIAFAKKRALQLTNEKRANEDNFDVKFFTQRILSSSQTSFNAGYLFLQKIYYLCTIIRSAITTDKFARKLIAAVVTLS